MSYPYNLTCMNGNFVQIMVCVNNNSGGLFGGLLCAAIYLLIFIAGSNSDYFANVMLATSLVLTIITGILWALINLQWWIVVLNFTVLVVSAVYKIWWRNE